MSGRVNADANLIGSAKIDENVKIVDVAAQSYAATNEMSAAYAKIFLQRLDGAKCNEKRIGKPSVKLCFFLSLAVGIIIL